MELNSQIVYLMKDYGYFIFFPISIIEGPIATIIAGTLSVLGLMNPYIIYCLAVLGDMVGDSIFYFIGRVGSKMVIKIVGINEQKFEKIKDNFNNHHGKTIILSKVAHGIGITGLVAAGSLKIPYIKYLKTCFFIALTQSAIFLFIGVFFGQTISSISKYLDYYSLFASIIVLALIFVFVYKKINIKDILNKWKI